MILNQTTQVSGFVTTQGYLQGHSLTSIENLLGYQSGRLRLGAIFLVAMDLPKIDGFDLAGYSQVAGHRTTEQYGRLNSPVRKDEKDALLIKKRNAMSCWSLIEPKSRLIKVMATIRHSDTMKPDIQYPPGAGIPQWVIRDGKAILFKVINIFGPAEYPNGRFIPELGFNIIK